MLASVLRLIALRPLLGMAILGVPVLVLLAVGLVTVFAVKAIVALVVPLFVVLLGDLAGAAHAPTAHLREALSGAGAGNRSAFRDVPTRFPILRRPSPHTRGVQARLGRHCVRLAADRARMARAAPRAAAATRADVRHDRRRLVAARAGPGVPLHRRSRA